MASTCTTVPPSSRRAVFAAASPPAAAPDCRKPVYLTLDTGNMRHAAMIADILRRRQVLATFFLANEDTAHGNQALGPQWDAYWQARVQEGHAFGSHTFDHVYFSAAPAAPAAAAVAAAAPRDGQAAGKATVRARAQFGASAGRARNWSREDVCAEIGRVDERFRRITGRALDRIWRAPGGRGPQALFDIADSCGWQHVGWAPAGFLGDELPSDAHPNDKLLARSLATIRSGDILMAHLGIRSRQDPYAPTLDALIVGLKARGFCFSTIPQHPSFSIPRP
jgi:peptidoglycan/xylan/chitin deacetylase (PgdA/CDA1 family)